MTRLSPLTWTVAVVALVVAVGIAFISLGARYRALEEDLRQQRLARAAVDALETRLGELTPLADDTAIPVIGRLAGRPGQQPRQDGVRLPPSALDDWASGRTDRAGARRPVSGPYRTIDGRWVLIVEDAGAGAGTIAAAVVAVDDLLAAAGIPALAQSGLVYQVSVSDPAGQGIVLARSSTSELPARAIESFPVADQQWQLALASEDTSLWRRSATWLTIVTTLLIACGLGLATYDVTTHAAALRDELHDHRHRLTDSARRLMDEVQLREGVEQQFAHAAFHDAVSGLPNRSHFAARINRVLYRIRQNPGASVAVLAVGLDKFKAVTESLGYAAGEELLRETARRIQACVEPADLGLSRIDGDELALLLEGVGSADDVGRLAERIQDALAAPFQSGDETVFPTVSIGVAVRSSGYADADELIREADIALSRAASSGRTRHAVFDPSARDEIVTQQQLETDLRIALDDEQFRLAFQPIVALDSGRVAGMEALIRWEHPRRGLLSPGQFLGTAEKMGLIVAINRWVIRAVAAQAHRWRERIPGSDFYVSTNLTAYDLRESDLCDFIRGVVRDAGLPAGSLRMEVTEGALIEDIKGARDFLAGLRQIGVPVLLDDFGTGYSSLGYLNQFRIDYLKIDRAFVHNMSPSAGDSRILKAIVNLAENLGIATIAEGIETEGELRLLTELACDYGQGYYFSKPVPVDQVEKLLTASRFMIPDARAGHRSRFKDRALGA